MISENKVLCSFINGDFHLKWAIKEIYGVPIESTQNHIHSCTFITSNLLQISLPGLNLKHQSYKFWKRTQQILKKSQF